LKTSACLLSVLLLTVFLLSTPLLLATEEYAQETRKSCAFCHQGPNGGPLSNVGIAYIRNGYNYPIPERVLDKSLVLSSPFHRGLRLVFGYLHLVFAAILVGTIFYVHIIIKPKSLVSGIPKGEKLLGLICMSVLAATGVYLTWYRLDSASSFFQSRFGLLLFIKILLFLVLVTLGVLAVTVISSMMRRRMHESQGASEPEGEEINGRDLSRFDGQEGRPAYIRYKNTVYDVSGSEKWKGGAHFRKHLAGHDLTESLKGAPHSEEVFSRFPAVAELSGAGNEGKGGRPTGVRKLYITIAYVNLALVFLILLCVGGWLWGFPLGGGSRTARALEPDLTAASCIACHQEKKPALVSDWKKSIHAKVGVSCADCHKTTDAGATWVSRAHFENSEIPVSGLVTPGRCAQCHEEEAAQYSRSKHAHTLEIIRTIDKWLIHGMNNEVERTTGCFACHGSVVSFTEGRPAQGTWPNVGVGRRNPDGSLGSCTSCHTRHRFSLVEARKPEACDQCHLGPDHPQIEIYNESKHGTIYHAYGDQWTWRPEDFHWRAGRDYRAPTCAGCHMSEAGEVEKTHDVTGRLAWELQAPLTIRPSEFSAFPANTDWRVEREKMMQVCLQCHSEKWVSGHFDNLDRVVESYNVLYYEPIKKMMDQLYAAGKLSDDSYFDEELEWEFYELWHHEGRRARMGAAMMAPDYAWWHGFYELKHRYVSFVEKAREQGVDDRAAWLDQFPGRFEENSP
jgi:hydroxylamine dehydrogenase